MKRIVVELADRVFEFVFSGYTVVNEETGQVDYRKWNWELIKTEKYPVLPSIKKDIEEDPAEYYSEQEDWITKEWHIYNYDIERNC